MLSSLLFYPARASHISGQDFTYILVDSSAGHTAGGLYHYRVSLTIYADCLNGQPAAITEDNPAYLGVYYGSGSEFALDSVTYSSADTISSSGTTCTGGVLAAFCSLKRTFVKDYYLPLSASGYVVVYQRCCWGS